MRVQDFSSKVVTCLISYCDVLYIGLISNKKYLLLRNAPKSCPKCLIIPEFWNKYQNINYLDKYNPFQNNPILYILKYILLLDFKFENLVLLFVKRERKHSRYQAVLFLIQTWWKMSRGLFQIASCVPHCGLGTQERGVHWLCFS